jgi:hypothetical protein
MSYRPSAAHFGSGIGGGFSRHQMYSPPSRSTQLNNTDLRDDSQYMNHGGFTEM